MTKKNAKLVRGFLKESAESFRGWLAENSKVQDTAALARRIDADLQEDARKDRGEYSPSGMTRTGGV